MRMLVAGDRGDIGAVLIPFLRAAGHQALLAGDPLPAPGTPTMQASR